MPMVREHVCNFRVPDSRFALYAFQSLAMAMPDKYENVNLPVYGGTYGLATLFLTRKTSGAKVEGRIQQTSANTLEASLIGHGIDEAAAIRELVGPLAEAYKKEYPKAGFTQEYV